MQYNQAASQLNPPRPPLTWVSVLNAVTLADFDLLRDTRTDIRSLPWAEPSRREATRLYFGIKRAREEIIWLNVEIKRLLTFMMDNHIDYYRAISANIMVNPSLARELSVDWEYQDRINNGIARRLLQASRLPGFTGSLLVGTRTGRDSSLRDGVPPPHWFNELLHGVIFESADGDDNDDDDVPRELAVNPDTIVELMERISTSDPIPS